MKFPASLRKAGEALYQSGRGKNSVSINFFIRVLPVKMASAPRGRRPHGGKGGAMRTLVTGATGFLGRHLVEQLLQAGETVRCFVRSRNALGSLPARSVEISEGEVGNAESLRRATEGVDVVFHLAGIRRASAREAFFQVNAEGTRNVCEAMAASGARRLVLCSSLAACGPSSPQRPRVEEDPPAPQEWYGESKLEGERIAFSFRDRFAVTAARPCRILGPGDSENFVFFRLVRKGLRLAVTGGPRPLSMVDVEDVARLLILLSQHEEAVGEAFFVATDETTSLEGVQDAVASLLGARPKSLRLSPALLRGMATVADVVSNLSRHPLPLNRKLARQLLAPAWTCSAAKAQRLLGFRPQFSVSDSIKRSTAWYQQQGWI
jgi:nucleoside-diphosphate-sugar epimerase